MEKSLFLILFLFSQLFLSNHVKAKYWLIIGSYRQGPGDRKEVSGITNQFLYSIHMEDLESCIKAGKN